MDKDLVFLSSRSNDELQAIADILVFDAKGRKLLLETLSKRKSYVANYPNNMKDVLPDIVDELQRCGGNKIRNLLRGHGVSYRELLMDVCKKVNVNFHKDNTTELIERYLLQKMLATAAEKMTDEDVKHISNKFNKAEDLKNVLSSSKIALPLMIRMTSIILVNISKQIGSKVLAGTIAKFAGGRLMSMLAGPVGWAIGGIWTTYDLLGPSYKRMLPAAITIAYYRLLDTATAEEKAEAFE